jgi:hypothetical protein
MKEKEFNTYAIVQSLFKISINLFGNNTFADAQRFQMWILVQGISGFDPY